MVLGVLDGGEPFGQPALMEQDFVGEPVLSRRTSVATPERQAVAGHQDPRGPGGIFYPSGGRQAAHPTQRLGDYSLETWVLSFPRYLGSRSARSASPARE